MMYVTSLPFHQQETCYVSSGDIKTPLKSVSQCHIKYLKDAVLFHDT